MSSDPPSDLLARVLARLDRGGAPDAQWPDRRGEYWALCPFHADRETGSFSVSERGFGCFSCGAQGGLAALAYHLAIDPAPREKRAGLRPAPTAEGEPTARLHGSQPGDTPPSLTLERYAEAKRLPPDLLQGLGLQTVYLSGWPAVRIPYFDRGGELAAVRFRLSLAGSGRDRFRWRRGSRPLLYGLWKLEEARAAGYVLLVEGESDSHTLWLHGLPALGVPGAACWKPAWAELLEGLAVYAWQEPDAGGAQFVQALGASLPALRVITPPAGRKDVSDCLLQGDDLPSLIAERVASAIPYREIQAAEGATALARAGEQAAPLLGCPDLLEEFSALCRRLGLVGEDRAARVLYLAVTSRLLDRPVSVAVKGPSAGGKSFLVETVLRAFPPAAYYALSSMSERALAYGTEPLAHRLLILYEAAGLSGDLGTYLLRSLLSEGRVRYETVEKTADGMVPRLIEREGPTGVITTTTAVGLEAELETRLISLTVRDDPQQTRSVLDSVARRANGGGVEVDLEPWWALQEWLRLSGAREVAIPFAAELAAACEPTAVRLRRDFGGVLGLVKAHALLHQKNRPAAGGRVVAGIADYRAVYALTADLVREGVQATVKPAIRETVEALAALYTGTPVTMAALAKRLGIDPTSALRRVAVARQNGWIVNQETRRRQPAQLVPGDPLPDERAVLPDPDSLPAEGGEGGAPRPAVHAVVQSAPPADDTVEIYIL